MTELDYEIFEEVDPIIGEFALTAASFPVMPPAEWFGDPGLTTPTPLTITADGRVTGHIAAWGTRHVGLPGNITPPRSRSKYAFFNKGLLATAEGKDVTVGQLTLAGGHAPIYADASRAVEHYDNTNSAVADIHVGEDKYGIWAAGAVRPDVNDSRLRVLRASVPSGDWRPINGGLELVAVCQVNSGGFPIARSMVASASGEIMALVAAGAQQLYNLKLDQARGDLGLRVELVEQKVMQMEKQALRAVVASLTASGWAAWDAAHRQANGMRRPRTLGGYGTNDLKAMHKRATASGDDHTAGMAKAELEERGYKHNPGTGAFTKPGAPKVKQRSATLGKQLKPSGTVRNKQVLTQRALYDK